MLKLLFIISFLSFNVYSSPNFNDVIKDMNYSELKRCSQGEFSYCSQWETEEEINILGKTEVNRYCSEWGTLPASPCINKLKEKNRYQALIDNDNYKFSFKKETLKKILEVNSLNCSSYSGVRILEGEVKNISHQKIHDLSAVGIFREIDQSFITSSTTLVEFTPLLVGQSSPFKIIIRNNPAIYYCNIKFKNKNNAVLPHVSNEIKEQELWEKKFGIEFFLDQLGFSVGKIDGVITKKTRNAISLFQKKYQLKNIGSINPMLAKTLIKTCKTSQCNKYPNF